MRVVRVPLPSNPLLLLQLTTAAAAAAAAAATTTTTTATAAVSRTMAAVLLGLVAFTSPTWLPAFLLQGVVDLPRACVLLRAGVPLFPRQQKRLGASVCSSVLPFARRIVRLRCAALLLRDAANALLGILA